MVPTRFRVSYIAGDVAKIVPRAVRGLASRKTKLSSINALRSILACIIEARGLGSGSIRGSIVGTRLRWGSVKIRTLALICTVVGLGSGTEKNVCIA